MKVYVIIGNADNGDPYDGETKTWVNSVWFNIQDAEDRKELLKKVYKDHDIDKIKELDYSFWECWIDYFYPDNDYWEIEEHEVQGKLKCL